MQDILKMYNHDRDFVDALCEMKAKAGLAKASVNSACLRVTHTMCAMCVVSSSDAQSPCAQANPESDREEHRLYYVRLDTTVAKDHLTEEERALFAETEIDTETAKEMMATDGEHEAFAAMDGLVTDCVVASAVQSGGGGARRKAEAVPAALNWGLQKSQPKLQKSQKMVPSDTMTKAAKLCAVLVQQMAKAKEMLQHLDAPDLPDEGITSREAMLSTLKDLGQAHRALSRHVLASEKDEKLYKTPVETATKALQSLEAVAKLAKPFLPKGKKPSKPEKKKEDTDGEADTKKNKRKGKCRKDTPADAEMLEESEPERKPKKGKKGRAPRVALEEEDSE